MAVGELLSELPKIVSIGEAIVDLIAVQPGLHNETEAFQKFLGGAPLNTAIGAARLGCPTGVVTALGADMFGRFIAETLKANEVDTRNVVFRKGLRTSLAFVSNDAHTGERHFMFYRKPWAETADSSLDYTDFSQEYIRSAEILHISGFALSQEPSRSAILRVVEEAKKKGITISLDPTLRLDVWNSVDEMQAVYEKAIGLADIASFSQEETEELLKTSNPSAAAETAIKHGVKIVGLKRGGKGSVLAIDDGTYIEADPVRVQPVDTTGAGDAWNAALLVGLVEKWPLEACPVIANAVGALVVTARGAITAMPTREQLRGFLTRAGLAKRLNSLGLYL